MFGFTHYLRSLDQGEPPSEEDFEQALEALGRVLRREMNRRGLGSSPPSFLGIPGVHWNDGSFEELLLECYEHIFVERLKSLSRRAERHDIEGLVRTNVRHFLYEAQRRNDPVGARMLHIAREAVRMAVERGKLSPTDEKGDTIRGNSLFEVSGVREADSPTRDPADAAAPKPTGLEPERVRSWVDELLPELLTAHRRRPVIEQLASRLAELEIPHLRFGDLSEPLAKEARQRWKVLFFGDGSSDPTEGEDRDGTGLDPDRDPLAVAIPRPGHSWEERQAAKALIEQVERDISRQLDGRSRQYLWKLWNFLLEQGAIWEEGPAVDPPSHLRLSELLGIPRGRIPELRLFLEERIVGFRRQVVGKPIALGGGGEIRPGVRGERNGFASQA
ncbi:MAG: hypothetical protein MI919_23530 [Holophagales bacterium]|nr:hypothetical protein [Holophagales bacterium]